jgi:hypothetical protein
MKEMFKLFLVVRILILKMKKKMPLKEFNAFKSRIEEMFNSCLIGAIVIKIKLSR